MLAIDLLNVEIVEVKPSCSKSGGEIVRCRLLFGLEGAIPYLCPIFRIKTGP